MKLASASDRLRDHRPSQGLDASVRALAGCGVIAEHRQMAAVVHHRQWAISGPATSTAARVWAPCPPADCTSGRQGVVAIFALPYPLGT